MFRSTRCIKRLITTHYSRKLIKKVHGTLHLYAKRLFGRIINTLFAIVFRVEFSKYIWAIVICSQQLYIAHLFPMQGLCNNVIKNLSIQGKFWENYFLDLNVNTNTYQSKYIIWTECRVTRCTDHSKKKKIRFTIGQTLILMQFPKRNSTMVSTLEVKLDWLSLTQMTSMYQFNSMKYRYNWGQV